MHQVCIEKITWPPLIHTSALKIVPLVVLVCTVGFVKCIDITVFCFILPETRIIYYSFNKFSLKPTLIWYPLYKLNWRKYMCYILNYWYTKTSRHSDNLEKNSLANIYWIKFTLSSVLIIYQISSVSQQRNAHALEWDESACAKIVMTW